MCAIALEYITKCNQHDTMHFTNTVFCTGHAHDKVASTLVRIGQLKLLATHTPCRGCKWRAI